MSVSGKKKSFCKELEEESCNLLLQGGIEQTEENL